MTCPLRKTTPDENRGSWSLKYPVAKITERMASVGNCATPTKSSGGAVEDSPVGEGSRFVGTRRGGPKVVLTDFVDLFFNSSAAISGAALTCCAQTRQDRLLYRGFACFQEAQEGRGLKNSDFGD